MKSMVFKYKTGQSIRVFIDDEGVAFFCLRDVMRLLGYSDTTPHSKLAAFSWILDSEKFIIPGENFQNASFLRHDTLRECLSKYGSKMAERVDILRWLDEEVSPVLAETENTPTTQQDDISPEVLELARAIAKVLRSAR